MHLPNGWTAATLNDTQWSPVTRTACDVTVHFGGGKIKEWGMMGVTVMNGEKRYPTCPQGHQQRRPFLDQSQRSTEPSIVRRSARASAHPAQSNSKLQARS